MNGLIIILVIYFVARAIKPKMKNGMKEILEETYNELNVEEKARKFIDKAQTKASSHKPTDPPEMIEKHAQGSTVRIEQAMEEKETVQSRLPKYSIDDLKYKKNEHSEMKSFFEDPKKAIILKEILDKPVSLRSFDS